jgi:signal peptidase I
MLPFMQTRILSWAQPQRGDIVVFQGPESENQLTLIKRVIGLPGDRISFTKGILTVNGVLAEEELQQDRTPLMNMGPGETGEQYNLYKEWGFSSYPHYILRKKWNSMTQNDTKTWIVPKSQLLLIGDNRDNSADGRFWGFVDQNSIYGRAFLISYSTYDKPKSFLPGFRNERWFSPIQN